MDRFDIVSALRTFATDKGWRFVFGNDEYANFETSCFNYEVDELVMVCDIVPLPVISQQGGAVQDVFYSGFIMLGRKFEVNTTASLDETMLQKHDRRLKDLWTLLANNVGVMACSNGLTIEVSNPANLINFYSSNIDFVKLDVRFSE